MYIFMERSVQVKEEICAIGCEHGHCLKDSKEAQRTGMERTMHGIYNADLQH